MCACSKTTLAHVRSTAMCQVPERHQGPPLRRILEGALPPISEVVAVCTGLCTHQAWATSIAGVCFGVSWGEAKSSSLAHRW